MFFAFMSLVCLVSLWLTWPSLTSLWSLVGLPAPAGWLVTSLFGHDELAEDWYPDTAWFQAKVGARASTIWVAGCHWAAQNPAPVLGTVAAVLLAFWYPGAASLGALVLVRGLPGSGKSTWARAQGNLVYEADQFFTAPRGRYDFDHTLVPEAHKWCQARVRAALARGETVFVANTFTQGWEIQPYVDLAAEAGVPLQVFTCPPVPGRLGVHGIPQAAWDRMLARWEPWEGENYLPQQGVPCLCQMCGHLHELEAPQACDWCGYWAGITRPWAGPGTYWLNQGGNGASIALGKCEDPSELKAALKAALNPRESWRGWTVARV